MPIRPATIDDIPELVRLVNSAYRGEGGWTGEAHLNGGPRTGAAEVFHAGDRFGTVKRALELAVLEKNLHK